MYTSLIELFFPKVCAGCDSLLHTAENVLCSQCRHDIPLTQHFLIPDNEAMKKFYGRIPAVHVSTFMYYHKKGIVQQMIHNLKYKGMEAIGKAIGDWYSEDLKAVAVMQTVDAIIPVPLHKRKLRKRGYNQVTAFGQALSKNLKIPYCDDLLFRKVYSKTQTKKNLLGRSEVGAAEIFDVKFSATASGKHYLLVDDVLTTGATLEACCRALLKIEGVKISIVCMAFSHS